MKTILKKQATIETLIMRFFVLIFLFTNLSIEIDANPLSNIKTKGKSIFTDVITADTTRNTQDSTQVKISKRTAAINACSPPDIGPDLVICQGASFTKTLTAPAGKIYEWSSKTTGTIIGTSQSITVNTADTYVLKMIEPGSTNLIANGDFSAGNTGFITQYTYAPNIEFLGGGGYYDIRPNGTPNISWASQFGDHTSGTGNYMFIDGNSGAGVKVWKQDITVTPNTNYIFSAWVRNLSPGGDVDALLNFDIGGANIGGVYTVASNPNPTANQWNQFYATWNSGNATSITISVEDNTLNSRYNDFAIDDIEFRTSNCVSTDEMNISYNTKTPPTIKIDPIVPVCKGMPVQLNASGAGTNGKYLWTPATDLSNTTIANPISTPLANRTYTVTGTDENDCSNTATITVSLKPGPVATFYFKNDYKSVCVGDQADVRSEFVAGYTYTWNQVGVAGSTRTGASFEEFYTQNTTSQDYSLTVTDATGCSDTKTLTLNLIKPMVNAGPDVSICGGTTPLQATGSLGTTFSWSPATNLSATNISNPIFTAGTTTTYTVTGSVIGNINNGTKTCTATDQVKVTVSPGNPVLVKANASKTNICIGEAVTLFGSLGNGNPMIWDNSITDNISFKPTTTKTYTVKNDPTSCAAGSTDQITITVKPQPIVSGGSPQAVCPGTPVTLNGSGASTYTWNNGVTNNVAFTPLVDKTYTVIGTDANGCKDTATVMVTLNGVNNTPITAVASKKSICLNDQVILTGQGGANYTWDNGVSNGIAFTPLTTQKYTLTSPATGCSPTKTDTITVVVNPLPTVSANDIAICPGAFAKLKGQGAASYTWSNGITDDVNFKVNIKTNYTVTGTDAHGCKNTGQATVTINTKPTVIAFGGAFCEGKTGVTLTTSGAGASGTYKWTPNDGTLSNTTINNPIATPTSTETYTVIATDSNGCKDTTTATVTVNKKPIILATRGAFCEGDNGITLSASGASGSSSYTWSPATDLSNASIPNPKATPSSTTIYTVTGTDGNGCSNASTTTVTVNAKPNIVATGGSVCKNDLNGITLNATGAGIGGIYTWASDPTLSNTSIYNPIAITNVDKTYTVTGTDVNGCKNSTTTNVKVNNLPIVTANTPPVVCQGTFITLTGAGAVSYSWDKGVVDNVPFKATTSTNYIVTGTDGNGCKNTKTVSVVIITAPDAPIIIVNSPFLCQFSTPTPVSATATQLGTIKWYKAANAVNSFPTPDVINTNIIQNQEFWASNTIGTCESEKAYAKVNIIANPEVSSITPPVICKGDILEVKLNFSGMPDFTLTYEYQNNSSSTTSNTNSKTLSFSPSTDGNIQFTKLTDKYCFTVYNNFLQSYVVNQKPTLTLNAEDTICDMSYVALHMSSNMANTQFSWTYTSPTDITGASIGSYNSTDANFQHQLHNTSKLVKDIVYTISTNANGCEGQSLPLVVKVLPSYIPTINTIGTVCAGTNITLHTEDIPFGYTLQWFKNNKLLVNETKTSLNTTINGFDNYVVEATDYCDNTVFAETNSLIYAPQHLKLTALDSCATTSTKLIAHADTLLDNIKWAIGSETFAEQISNHQSSITHTFPSPGKYNIHLQGLLGTCLLADTTFEFISTDCNLHFVNTFTPNDDQANDVWQIEGIEKQPQASLCIFNRWGVIIKKYESHIPFNTWDGTNTEGQLVENATYYYVLDLKSNKKPIKGYVTLLTKISAQ
jgi:gliding motility-associated-like protein